MTDKVGIAATEPHTSEPDELHAARWWQLVRAAVVKWVRRWGSVVTITLGAVSLLAGMATCSIGSYVDSLNRRIDEQTTTFNKRIDDQTNAVNKRFDDQTNAVNTRISDQTQHIDIQTQSVKDVLTEKIVGQSEVLTVKIDHVDEKLDTIDRRIDGVDRRIDGIVADNIAGRGIAATDPIEADVTR